ncbi:FABP family protein [Streptomyces armeniacus]|uniref:Ferric nitrobindin-like protein n=1 Tax=Streptomyces armeniacus TaxID=83291 RepID=A0A345XS81_9ACTN|nr:FABP family protein [Streptomyces armeniacus]AXK34497.1 FABP family protein [Streptomyces armeniacus]
MIEIPSDLHPDLVPLAFLLGNWTGAGVAALDGDEGPGTEKCNFGQEVAFSHDGRDFLEYVSHSWALDADGKKTRPLETETGYWRIDKDRQVEVVMIRDQGVAEVWYGEMAHQKPQIDLATDAIARTASAGAYTGGKRLYGYVNGDLMWVGERSTPDTALYPYMSAQLKKAVDPSEWAKDIKDLPDDGIAFFR